MLDKLGANLLDLGKASAIVETWWRQTFLGDNYPEMTRNQVANLRERRIRTVTYVCEA